MPPSPPPNAKVRLRTKKNHDGSQQYVRGKSDYDRQMVLHGNLDTTYANPNANSSKARKALLAAMQENLKPVLARLKIRRDKDIQNNNRDRSR